MISLVPEVHLFICLDQRLSPGPILQALDIIRCKNWQSELILLCDSSWKSVLGPEQSVIYLNREEIYHSPNNQPQQINNKALDQFLEQLDSLEITEVTQLGHLSWARWLNSYLDQVEGKKYNTVSFDSNSISSIDLLNQLAAELKIDLSIPQSSNQPTAEVFLDPYHEQELSHDFIKMVTAKDQNLPDWMTILCWPSDEAKLKKLGLAKNLMDYSEGQAQIQNQNVICFSDRSPLACCSRSNNIALFNCVKDQSLFMSGDLSIRTDETLYWSELFSIITYWKTGRLKELAFQWLKKGIEIETVELNHNRLTKRNLINYSTDLFCCHALIDQFKAQSEKGQGGGLSGVITQMRRNMQNDPYALSYSLKLLILITERMLASASCGERLFHRLGSDYHRIIIGEALVEGLFEGMMKQNENLSIPKELRSLLKFMIQVDFINDEWVERQVLKAAV